MSNFKEDILKAADGPIEAIVIGEFGGFWRDEVWLERPSLSTKHVENKLIQWAEAGPLLDYEYDEDFGNAQCHSITAWTKSSVLVIHEFDGKTHVRVVPRNPVPHEPRMK